MTPKQIERKQLKIKKIRAALAAEKRKLGCFDDSGGMRYIPPSLYIEVADFRGGLYYYRWFTKNFSDDYGSPKLWLEFAIIHFNSKKLKTAEQLIYRTIFCNVYALDKFFLRIPPPTPGQEVNLFNPLTREIPVFWDAYMPGLEEFAEWLSALESSQHFKEIRKDYIQKKLALDEIMDTKLRSQHIREIRDFMQQTLESCL